MIFHLLGQIFTGCIALIPVIVSVSLFAWLAHFVFTSSFRYDPALAHAQNVIGRIRKGIKIAGGLFGAITGYFILVELLNIFVVWGWMSAVKPHLANILSAWAVIVIFLVIFMLIRMGGLLTWKMVMKNYPMNQKPKMNKQQQVENQSGAVAQGKQEVNWIPVVSVLFLAVFVIIGVLLFNIQPNAEQSNPIVNYGSTNGTASQLASATTNLLGISH